MTDDNEKAAPEVSAPAEATTPQTKFPWLNLVLLLSIAAFVGWWLFYYTEWLDSGLKLLGLGGFLGIAGIVFKFLPKQYNEEIQKKFAEKLLNNRKATRIMIFLLFAGLPILFTFFGAIQVESLGGKTDYEFNLGS